MNELLSEIQAGGSHSSNPNGGVPIGQGNTAQQGETMTKDYVFSDDLFLNESILKRYNLPKKLKGKSIAKASKVLTLLSEESNSAVDKETSNELLDRLKGINEELKPQEEPQAQPQEGKQFTFGGVMGGVASGAQYTTNVYDANMGGGSGGMSGGQMGALGGALGSMYKGVGGQGYSLTKSNFIDEKSMQDAKNNQAIDKTKDAVATVVGPWGQLFRGIQKAGVGIGNAVGGDTGAGISDLFSPEESTMSLLKDKDANTWEKIGGTVPILGGVISKRQQEEREGKLRHRNTLAVNSQYRQTDFKMGGKRYNDGGERDPLEEIFGGDPFATTPVYGMPKAAPLVDPKKFDEADRPRTKTGAVLKSVGNFFRDDVGGFIKDPKVQDKAGNILNDAMRFSPVLSNYLQYKNLKKPGYEALDRVSSKYRKDLVDENALVNQVKESESTTRRALREASGGNMGDLRSNLLQSHLNSIKGKSQAFLQADEINRKEGRMAQQFDNRNDQFNVGQSNLEKDINARNIAAYDNNRSKMLSAITENLSNIGLENQRKKYPERAGLLYDFLGEYLNKKDSKTTV